MPRIPTLATLALFALSLLLTAHGSASASGPRAYPRVPLPFCGDAAVDVGETCDEGVGNDDAFGFWCTDACTMRGCGAPVSAASGPSAADALYVLKVTVGSRACDKRVCDIDGNGLVAAPDALRVLRRSVGQNVEFSCPGGLTCVGKTFSTAAQVFTALAGQHHMVYDGGAGGLGSYFSAASSIRIGILPDFLGSMAVTTTVNNVSAPYTAYWKEGQPGWVFEDLAHEVNLYFGVENGTAKILQCDKTTGQLTYVIDVNGSVVSFAPNFARIVSAP